MAENQSPYLLTKDLETQLKELLAPIDLFELERAPRKGLTDLNRQIVDARLDARDYELSETREEQLQNARQARKRLEHVRKDILTASEYNIFSAIDVAQLSANVEHIIERLE